MCEILSLWAREIFIYSFNLSLFAVCRFGELLFANIKTRWIAPVQDRENLNFEERKSDGWMEVTVKHSESGQLFVHAPIDNFGVI
jgi:hypothetical protein